MSRYLIKRAGLIKAEVSDNFNGIMEYGNSGILGDIVFKMGTRWLLGSLFQYSSIPTFHYSNSLDV
jgi:hypothetical protein